MVSIFQTHTNDDRETPLARIGLSSIVIFDIFHSFHKMVMITLITSQENHSL
jgi:hypothetical protein